MFQDKVRTKAVVISFVAYLVTATVIFAIVMRIWWPVGKTPEEVARIAESDPTLLLWQNVLGTILGILAGYLACRLSGRLGLKNSLVLGIALILYGILGIFLHPDHPIGMQLAKLVAPIPLALLGGWLCLRFTSRNRLDQPDS